MNREKQKTLYTVGEVTNLTGVTRKTLFYYDRIGLLTPIKREGLQGHKVYDQKRLNDLKQILFYKEAGLRLSEIQLILNESEDKEKIFNKALKRMESEYQQKETEIKKLKELIDECHEKGK